MTCRRSSESSMTVASDMTPILQPPCLQLPVPMRVIAGQWGGAKVWRTVAKPSEYFCCSPFVQVSALHG